MRSCIFPENNAETPVFDMTWLRKILEKLYAAIRVAHWIMGSVCPL
ncbi:MAG: hypothetical protein ACSLEL_03810 [Candidatus Malihini olakiniferum]